MIEKEELKVPVPGDLSRVKEKILFGLTLRQLVCFGLALAVGLPVYFLIRHPAGSSAATFAMILVMLPFFLLAMYTKHGQPPERILRHYADTVWNRPKYRPCRTGSRQILSVRADRRKEDAGEAKSLSR